ncbi:MAG: ABC transporter ATP-binding protein [Planctomycetota bacterium]
MLCELDQLTIALHRPFGEAVDAVMDFSMDIAAGRTTALVGESGAGKTLIVRALLGLLPPRVAFVRSGAVRWQGREIWRTPQDADLRGRHIAAVFQDPGAALNPVFRIGEQIIAAIRAHRSLSRSAARREAGEWLERVGIEDAARRLDAYPHELSGGEKQRAAIAAALVHNPELLVADEPTSALDVQVQGEILALLRERQAEQGTAILLVSHDLKLVDFMADEVVVAFAGRVVESYARGAEVRHPYTKALRVAGLGPRVSVEKLAELPPARVVPGPGLRPSGCNFEPFCGYAVDACHIDPAPKALALTSATNDKFAARLACPPIAADLPASSSKGAGA